MQAEIKLVSIDTVHSNPHRYLEVYPWIEKKLLALQHSIHDVGMWESIIAREHEGEYQMAFGHHRIEAAKRAGVKEIPIIIRALTDKEMLQFMGRENGEDYKADFLIMLNTWEGAVKFLENQGIKNNAEISRQIEPIEIAKLLGWTDINKDYVVMSHLSRSCNSAHKLVIGSYITREDLSDLSVRAASEVVTRAVSRIEQIDKMAQATKRPKAEIVAAKKAVSKGAIYTAEKVRKGEVTPSRIKQEVDSNAYKAAGEMKEKASPLFDVFGKALANRINQMLASDASTAHLNEISESLHLMTLETDMGVVRRIDFELEQLGIRTEEWRKKLVVKGSNVTSINQAKKGITNAN